MDKSSGIDISLQDQRDAWNRWNAEAREHAQGEVSKRQAAVVKHWLDTLALKELELIDIGCGAGPLCQDSCPFGLI